MQRQKCIYLNPSSVEITTYGATFKAVLAEFVRNDVDIRSMYYHAYLVMVF